jgi:hypothetical protein
MKTNCNTGVNIPTPIIDECKGKYTSTKCIVHPDPAPILDLPIGTILYDIIIKQNLAIQSNRALVDDIKRRIDNAGIPV